jgi:UDPglucose 6-dehydrogenase
MNVTVLGSGYVGLVTAACLAEIGNDVVCFDIDRTKIEALSANRVPFHERDLPALVERNGALGRLHFTTNVAFAIRHGAVVFIATGTPPGEDGGADLGHVLAAARSIGRHMQGEKVVVQKSTVPVGTAVKVRQAIETELGRRRAEGDADALGLPAAAVAIVANPEFLKEGAAVDDFMRPDRIVIGIEDEAARAPMTEVYRPLYLNAAPIMFTSRRTAELIKYAANAFLAMKITFINEIADLSEKAGTNVQEVARGIGLDNRIGTKFLHAGPGYGGSCFPKDPLALVKTGHDFGSPLRLVETTVAVNEQRKRAMGRKVISACGGEVRGKTLGVLGLTFKPNTDDLREAPSLSIIQALLDAGAKVRAYDPKGMEAAAGLLPGIGFGTGPYEVAEGADALVIVTEWNEFRSLDFDRLRLAMRTPLLVDLRNIYRRAEVEAHGFLYECVGRPLLADGSAVSEAAE